MLFPTVEFAVFFSIVFFLAIFFKPYRSIYSLFLIIVSFVFYSYFNTYFALILGFSILVNFILAKVLINRTNRFILILGILINVLILSYFKYLNFFVDSINQVLNASGSESINLSFQILIPIGISFFSFKQISILFDIFRKKINEIKFLDFALYISFFPQITAGPISRAKEFFEDIKKPYKYDRIEVFLLLASGLIKKLVISSLIFNFIQDPFKVPESFSSIDLFIAVLGYGAYIYSDFSGYSDMAQGITKLLGFRGLDNFNMPYGSLSLIDFWRRWHMSLSSWIKDYIYIPLGGSRYGKIRKYLNLLITMTLAGLWHGAGLNFIFWGFLHGLGLIINHTIRDSKIVANQKGISKLIINLFGFLITFSFVNLIWIFFNTRTFEIAQSYFEKLFSLDFTTVELLQPLLISLIVIVFLTNFFGQKIYKIMFRILKFLHPLLRVILMAIIVYIIIKLSPSGVAPFVYFNF